MPAKSNRRCGNRLCLMTLTWLCLSVAGVAADDGFVPIYNPELTVSRASGGIEVDGFLEDPGWRGAAKADNFAEHNPGDQTRPDVDTEVLITYDDDNLYVAWLCYDDPNEVRASFCERDQIFSDDYVILCLDTFGEATLAYEISSNPYGIPGDLLFSSSNGEDSSYDMIFESAGRITENGWIVEMAVPFSSMRFPDRGEQVWRVDFWRNRPRESRYQYSWAAYNRDEDCWPCQWGTVKGIAGARPGAGLELLPAVVSHQAGSLGDDGNFENFENGDINGDVSLGIAYDISSELTAEATINPDFSQVESDAAQIDVNSTFALFYPERRPFFQEGSDLFDTYFNAVYTRSINDPLLAGKTTWRKGPNSVAFLTGRDEHSVIMLPFEEGSAYVENGKSYSNVVRARHDLGGQSHIGFVATDRRFEGGGSGSLGGLDGQIRFLQSNVVRFQLLASHTGEVDNLGLADSAFNVTTFDAGKHTAGLDGESFWGQGLYASVSRNTSNYWGGAEYWDRSPTFRADNGFEPSNNVRMGNTWVGGIVRFDHSKILENVSASMNLAREWNYAGVKKDEWINVNLETKFRAAQTGMHASYLQSNELFGNVQFNGIWQVHNCLSTQPSGELRFGGYVNYGHRIARRFLVMGMEKSYGIWADVKPVHRLLVSSSYDYLRSDDLHSGGWLFSQAVFRSHWQLQLSREFSARIILQYNDRWDTWDTDPLFTYRLNPFTVFYVGSTHDYRDLTLDEHGREGWALTDRQYFLKIQYLFQM